MTRAIAKREGDLATAVGGLSREQIDTLKGTVAKGATDVQLALFLEICRARQLDPFTRQVHWSAQIGGAIVGIDGMRAIAERTGAYCPGPTRYEVDEKGGLVAAHVTVRKLVGGTWFDLEESAYLSEYGGRSPIWRQMPRVMLAKCAEARALRRAFPAHLSGLYSQDEVEQAQPRDVTPQPPTVVVEQAPVVRPEQAPRFQPPVREVARREAPQPDPDPDRSSPPESALDEEGILLALVGAADTADELVSAREALTKARESGRLTGEAVRRLATAYTARREALQRGAA